MCLVFSIDLFKRIAKEIYDISKQVNSPIEKYENWGITIFIP